jgi:hypothetical protein
MVKLHEPEGMGSVGIRELDAAAEATSLLDLSPSSAGSGTSIRHGRSGSGDIPKDTSMNQNQNNQQRDDEMDRQGGKGQSGHGQGGGKGQGGKGQGVQGERGRGGQGQGGQGGGQRQGGQNR